MNTPDGLPMLRWHYLTNHIRPGHPPDGMRAGTGDWRADIYAKSGTSHLFTCFTVTNGVYGFHADFTSPWAAMAWAETRFAAYQEFLRGYEKDDYDSPDVEVDDD
jgi:hypothetical protein